jgi:hypothetical protein
LVSRNGKWEFASYNAINRDYDYIAHGEHELKERPKKAEELETARSTPPLPRTRNNIINNNSENINVDTHDSPDQRDSWRTGGNQNEYNNRST